MRAPLWPLAMLLPACATPHTPAPPRPSRPLPTLAPRHLERAEPGARPTWLAFVARNPTPVAYDYRADTCGLPNDAGSILCRLPARSSRILRVPLGGGPSDEPRRLSLRLTPAGAGLVHDGPDAAVVWSEPFRLDGLAVGTVRPSARDARIARHARDEVGAEPAFPVDVGRGLLGVDLPAPSRDGGPSIVPLHVERDGEGGPATVVGEVTNPGPVGLVYTAFACGLSEDWCEVEVGRDRWWRPSSGCSSGSVPCLIPPGERREFRFPVSSEAKGTRLRTVLAVFPEDADWDDPWDERRELRSEPFVLELLPVRESEPGHGLLHWRADMLLAHPWAPR